MTGDREEIRVKVEEIVKSCGCELIDFKIFSSRRRNTLRCIADYPKGGITVGDCTKINKSIFTYLDESGALGEDFAVEVNSPGLDRPLKTAKDFLRVKSKAVLLWLNEPLEDKTYFEGEVADVDDECLSLLVKDKILKISFSKIKSGKEKIK